MNLRRLWAISSKEIKQLVRERGTISMVVMIPIIELLLFGYAINTDVRHLPAAVVDQSHTAFSRYLIEDVAATQVVDFVASVATVEELETLNIEKNNMVQQAITETHMEIDQLKETVMALRANMAENTVQYTIQIVI